MKIEYFLLFTAGIRRSVAMERGAVLKKELYGDMEFTVVSMKDRLAQHNRAAKRAADGTPRFTDEDRFLLWLHQEGEIITYVKAEKPSGHVNEAAHRWGDGPNEVRVHEDQ